MEEQHLQPGDIRIIEANSAPEGYVFDQWTGDTVCLDDAMSSSTRIVMPVGDVVVNSTYITTTPTTTCKEGDTEYGLLYNCYVIHRPVTKYGVLYNWYAVMDSRNIANTGWHLATQNDYTILQAYLGGTGTLGAKLKDTEYWDSPNEGATNEVGFNLRASGQRYDFYDYDFYYQNQYAFLYVSNSIPQGITLATYYGTNGGTFANNVNPNNGNAVRLVKDSTILSNGQSGYYVGNDEYAVRTICIGTQEWLADDLVETKYRNGNLIPIVESAVTWGGLSTGAMCYYNNDITNCFVYDDSSISPSGWHVPTFAEWETLIYELGDETEAGGHLKEIGTTHWNIENADNSSGFSARGAGYRDIHGTFLYLKTYSKLWTSTYSGGTFVSYYIQLYSGGISIPIYGELLQLGASLRLIKDNSTFVKSVTDYDGNVYPCVKIGNQVWMAQNLRVTSFSDGTPIPEITNQYSWEDLTTPGLCAYDNNWRNVGCGAIAPTTTTTTTL